MTILEALDHPANDLFVQVTGGNPALAIFWPEFPLAFEIGAGQEGQFRVRWQTPIGLRPPAPASAAAEDGASGSRDPTNSGGCSSVGGSSSSLSAAGGSPAPAPPGSLRGDVGQGNCGPTSNPSNGFRRPRLAWIARFAVWKADGKFVQDLSRLATSATGNNRE